MKITQSHLTFWNQHKAPTPGWSGKLEHVNKVSVHMLINSQVGRSYKHDAHNAMAILRLVYKREGAKGVRASLARMARGIGASKRRASYARKWLKGVSRS